jgi:ABC-type cobalamin/Fe3+-siderophores transport system ATPase subunit
MRIESISIKGFRCFSAEGEVIELNDLTCLVGPNASGKTAAMVALTRMFGETQDERKIRDSDFYLAPGETLESQEERQLLIEAKVAYPELERNPPAGNAVPETFNQMIVDAPGGTPYCRIRLDATWARDGTASGDIQQRLSWILTVSDDPDEIEGKRQSVKPTERARIRIVYLPATRDPSSQIRSTSVSMYGRLLRSIDWAGKDDDVRSRLAELRTDLSRLPGIGTMNDKVQLAWRKLYDGRVASNLAFEAVDADPSALLDLLAPTFAPDEQGQSIRYKELSDGLRSLFALSLPLGLYQVEELLKTDAAKAGFKAPSSDALPLLTIFAVEEPENHLSPHYLGKVVIQLLEIASSPTAQIVLSSHSPSIMARVEPDDVRYFLGGETRPHTKVRTLNLPDSQDEAFRYVREAVRSHPELYFARLVILGEGPSEEIILRKLFEASGTPLDAYFVSVVPLGGRHVNHFWRLLKGLGIPYITLLDLDREREGGGWGRIQYVRDQLVALHGEKSKDLQYPTGPGKKASLADKGLAELSKKDDRSDLADMVKWVDFFQASFAVFFSSPLDIDLAMLECFPQTYKSQVPAGGGPKLPVKKKDRMEANRRRMRQVLAGDPDNAPDELGSTYKEDQIELLPWYKYIFMDGSKPVAHMTAVASFDGAAWIEKAPPILRQLLSRAREMTQSNTQPDHG